MTGGYDLKPYTSKAKKAIDLAARISKKMNYSYVGTEHILAGLIKEGTGVAAEVLTACNVEYDKLISMIEDLISPGDNIEVMDRDGYSPRTQRVLERASEEADRFECNEIGTEHLLMAIVLQGDCAAARLLNTMGVNSQKMFIDILGAMGEDPTLKYVHNHETHQRMIGGLGDQHLDVAAAKLKSKFGMEVKMSEPKIAYREAIRKPVTIESKYKKQSGGHGQYGHVKIEFEPYDGDELMFCEKVFGGAVPKNFFPAVEKGLQEAAEHGSIGGFPVVRLKATLIDGSYHPVDSSEMAFKTAASMAFKDCMKEAQPYLLEPVDSLKILLPDDKQGDVMSVLSKRRGSVLGMNSVGGGMTELHAEAPEAELGDFALTLRQITQGLGEFTSEFARYDMLPPGTEIKS